MEIVVINYKFELFVDDKDFRTLLVFSIEGDSKRL